MLRDSLRTCPVPFPITNCVSWLRCCISQPTGDILGAPSLCVQIPQTRYPEPLEQPPQPWYVCPACLSCFAFAAVKVPHVLIVLCPGDNRVLRFTNRNRRQPDAATEPIQKRQTDSPRRLGQQIHQPRPARHCDCRVRLDRLRGPDSLQDSRTCSAQASTT